MDDIAIYETGEGRVEVRLDRETVWLSQKQMAALFGKNVRTISEHLRNIFRDGELDGSAVVRDFRITAADGKIYTTACYDLDVVISVGYRVQSREGIRFRRWATRTLREHLVRGYTLNRHRLETSARDLEAALALVKRTAASDELTADQGSSICGWQQAQRVPAVHPVPASQQHTGRQ